MERIKNILLSVLLVLLIGSVLWNGGKGINGYKCGASVPDTVRTTFVDTIPYYKPVPKEEKPLGSITAKLPVSVPKLSETEGKLPENVQKIPETPQILQDSLGNFGKNFTDSATVQIPITQTVYEDSTYTAYVSGYRASLDSLIFRMPREVTMITNTHYQKPKRWSVGIQVGYGMTLKGTPQFAPYMGIGVSYNLFSF